MPGAISKPRLLRVYGRSSRWLAATSEGRPSGCVDGRMRGALEITGDFYNLKGADCPSPLEHTRPDGPR